ncbi:hypothetical protein BJX99DRAFT_218325 [Aspergillus californicus]
MTSTPPFHGSSVIHVMCLDTTLTYMGSHASLDVHLRSKPPLINVYMVSRSCRHLLRFFSHTLLHITTYIGKLLSRSKQLYQTSQSIKMSNRVERDAEDFYERENDESPVTGDFTDRSYASSGAARIPVQADNMGFEDPMQPPGSNSNQQLKADEAEAIDKSNVLRGSRTRGAKPQYATGYSEGPDEDDLPAEVENTGRSST